MSIRRKKVGFWINSLSKDEKSFTACARVTKNKAIEVFGSCTKRPTEWFRICTQWTRRTHQPGLCISLTLLWLKFEFSFFDKRSWDHRMGRYYIPPEEPKHNTQFKYF